ncbi:MAG: hypothetical protein ABI758_00275 [Candidatus Woesebacteria bacterium]
MRHKEKPERPILSIETEAQQRRLIEARRAELLVQYRDKKIYQMHAWSLKYPKLSQHHVRHVIEEVIAHLEMGRSLYDDYDAVIDSQLSAFTRKIKRQIDIYTNPTSKQKKRWKQQFPYLSQKKKIVKFFGQMGHELEKKDHVFVSVIFDGRGEIGLYRETELNRLIYYEAQREKEQGMYEQKDDTVTVDHERLFLASVFLKAIAKKWIVLPPLLLPDLMSLVLKYNSKSFDNNEFVRAVFVLGSYVPVAVMLWIGREAKREMDKAKARIKRDSDEPTADLSNSTTEAVLDPETLS